MVYKALQIFKCDVLFDIYCMLVSVIETKLHIVL